MKMAAVSESGPVVLGRRPIASFLVAAIQLRAFLPATTLIYAVGAGIAAATGDALALRFVLRTGIPLTVPVYMINGVYAVSTAQIRLAGHRWGGDPEACAAKRRVSADGALDPLGRPKWPKRVPRGLQVGPRWLQ